jgi:hypothetical protein
MPKRNNRGIVTIRDMTRTAVATSDWISTFPRRRIHATTEQLFSVRSVLRGYKNDKEDRLSQLSLETPACQDMSLGAEELNCCIRITECSSEEMKVWLCREDLARDLKKLCAPITVRLL